MSEKTPVEDVRDRFVGQRFYDEANDESLTVVDVTSNDGVPVLVLLQYDDGIAWDESATPDTFGTEAWSTLVGVEQGGIDSQRYTPLGSGPTISESYTLCSGGSHEWTPWPDEIWPEGLPHFPDDMTTPRNLYDRLVRCSRCGLSGGVAAEYMGHEAPWFCGGCDKAFTDDELVFDAPGWGDTLVCESCAESEESVSA